MSAIPKSVMNAAWMEEAKVHRACKGGRNYSMTEIAEAIARAIMADRKRRAAKRDNVRK